MTLPFWTRGDLNAFFGLGINMLVNVLVLAGLCIGVVNIAPDDVYGIILPALGIELLIGNLFYFYLARRLAMKERRTDVTALPYGPSVPSIAARGVRWRIAGPTKAPMRMITPMMKAQASPASHAFTGSLVAR